MEKVYLGAISLILDNELSHVQDKMLKAWGITRLGNRHLESSDMFKGIVAHDDKVYILAQNIYLMGLSQVFHRLQGRVGATSPHPNSLADDLRLAPTLFRLCSLTK